VIYTLDDQLKASINEHVTIPVTPFSPLKANYKTVAYPVALGATAPKKGDENLVTVLPGDMIH